MHSLPSRLYTSTSDILNIIKVYNKTTGSLIQTITNPNLGDVDSNVDAFGNQVSSTDVYMLVSAPQDDTWSTIPLSGSFYKGVVYVLNASTGETLFRLVNPEPSPTGGFGVWSGSNKSTAIFGNFFIVGTQYGRKAYVYEIY